MNYKTILITGGAGFVGSNLSIFLKQKYPSTNIIAFDNLYRKGSELNVPRLEKFGVKFVKGDVRSKDDLFQQNPDLIIECSAEPSVHAGNDGSTDYLINTNLMGAINCLELAKKAQADFYFISTSRVYPYHLLNDAAFDETNDRFDYSDIQTASGLSKNGVSEDFPIVGAKSLYGATKFSAELFIEEYAEAFGVKSFVNRFGCIAGPWQMGKVDQGVMALWVYKHFFKQELSYLGFGGEGKQVRDFIHIDDFLEIVDLQLSNFEKVRGQTFNIGGGLDNSVSLKELTEICQNLTGNEIAISSDPETRSVDLKAYISDNSKISELFSWKPKKSVEAIVKDTLDWIKANEEVLKKVWNIK